MTPSTSRESCDAFRIEDASYAALIKAGKGAYYFKDDHLHCVLPDGKFCRLPLDGTRGWTWDGNLDTPTITPSILTSVEWGPERRYIELWHGYLTKGRFVSV